MKFMKARVYLEIPGYLELPSLGQRHHARADRGGMSRSGLSATDHLHAGGIAGG
jgi:hypothetical protein